MIKSQEPPDKTTPGNVGDLYQDIKTGKVYRCVDVKDPENTKQFITFYDRSSDKTEYVWKPEVPGMISINGLTYLNNWNNSLFNSAKLYLDTSNVEDFSKMFYDCTNLTTIPELDTSKGTDFSEMFHNCTNLTTIPEIDTSNGTKFINMFYNCTNLTSIQELDTSKCSNFYNMFRNCSKLTYIPELDTSKGTVFTYMFYNCTNLTTIPEIDTSKGTYFASMFNNCTNLTTIPELDTSKGTDFSEMFYKCTNLTSIPKLDLNKATNVTNMLAGTPKMENLKLYNIRIALTICTTYYAPFTDESLINTIQELCTAESSTKLTVGGVAHSRLSNMYCKIIDDTTEKKEMEICESTEEGAMTLEDYALTKNWTLA